MQSAVYSEEGVIWDAKIIHSDHKRDTVFVAAIISR